MGLCTSAGLFMIQTPSLNFNHRRFLKEPLLTLDLNARSHDSRYRHPAVVFMLLDALDEADDGGKGWEPVTRLVAQE